TEDQKPQTVIQAPIQPASRASMPVVSRTVYIYMVTATPDPQTVAAPSAVKIKPSAKPPTASSAQDLPAMPQLAAIPDMPALPAPAPRGGGGGGGHPAPAPQHPQPQQPPVITKTS
ncbi:MAG TPA: hypothetical protein VF806_08130, partial [Anaerolineaceae bacterium]